ncbi:MAG: S8 family serine peptidase [Acidobacteria bacterium]|nr:S8 family serine peptidase [Acidobacteriota bacterium]
MAKVRVLVEITHSQPEAFAVRASLFDSPVDSVRASEGLLTNLAGFGLEVTDEFPPVPMFADTVVQAETVGFSAFDSPETSPDAEAASVVVSCEVERSKLQELQAQAGVQVWPDAEITLFPDECCSCSLGFESDDTEHPFDLARSNGGTDCRPFRPGVSIQVIRQLLSVGAVWRDGFRGQNIVVGIVDEGVNGQVYPVVGGFSSSGSPRPGSAAITSHGSMCAADVLVAAPAAKLYDYPFMQSAYSGTSLRMFQAALDQRRLDGTPHILNNSWGFRWVSQASSPAHPNWDANHPFNRKVREVVASGAAVFFAAGNCGQQCPSGNCVPGEIGPGKSILGPGSLKNVITVAAVNSRHERIGYSSQGPGYFTAQKPDIASYSHLFGNFGPGRPGGNDPPFDNGTSAATPVATGVAALLRSALGPIPPEQLKQALIQSAINLGVPGWDTDTGFGVINAGAAYALLRR